MRRGDVVTIVDRQLGRLRPAVVIQTDSLAATDTVLVCPTTTFQRDETLFRSPIAEHTAAGLREPSALMVERLTFINWNRCGPVIGRLAASDIDSLDRSLAFVVGLEPH